VSSVRVRLWLNTRASSCARMPTCRDRCREALEQSGRESTHLARVECPGASLVSWSGLPSGGPDGSRKLPDGGRVADGGRGGVRGAGARDASREARTRSAVLQGVYAADLAEAPVIVDDGRGEAVAALSRSCAEPRRSAPGSARRTSRATARTTRMLEPIGRRPPAPLRLLHASDAISAGDCRPGAVALAALRIDKHPQGQLGSRLDRVLVPTECLGQAFTKLDPWTPGQCLSDRV
jgi:hypothetical protein